MGFKWNGEEMGAEGSDGDGDDGMEFVGFERGFEREFEKGKNTVS